MMGHMRIKTTQIYAKVTDKKVEEDMKKLKDSSVNRETFLYEEEFEKKNVKGSSMQGKQQRLKCRNIGKVMKTMD